MRILLTAIVTVSLLGLPPLPARAHHWGCEAIGNVTGPPVSCQYVAEGPSNYTATFATSWSITVIRPDWFGRPQEVVLARGNLTENEIDRGEINTFPGEVVTIEIRRGFQQGVLGRVASGHWG